MQIGLLIEIGFEPSAVERERMYIIAFLEPASEHQLAVAGYDADFAVEDVPAMIRDTEP